MALPQIQGLNKSSGITEKNGPLLASLENPELL